MSLEYKNLINKLTPDELNYWELVSFCIEQNYKRELKLKVDSIYSEAKTAESFERYDLSQLLYTIASQIMSELERKRIKTIESELEGLFAIYKISP